MPPAGLEPAIPASERPQTHALERAAIGIDLMISCQLQTVQIVQEENDRPWTGKNVGIALITYWHKCIT